MNEAINGMGNGGLKRAGGDACCCKETSVKEDVSIVPAAGAPASSFGFLKYKIV